MGIVGRGGSCIFEVVCTEAASAAPHVGTGLEEAAHKQWPGVDRTPGYTA